MGFLRMKLLGPTRVECSESPWIDPPRGFRLFVPRHYATSRRFRHQSASVNPCCLVRVQVRARSITAVSGPL